MADSLSRSEIESLLAATRADSAILPASGGINQNVDFKSFDRDAATKQYFTELIQCTVDAISQSVGIELAIGDVDTSTQLNFEYSEEWTQVFMEAGGGQWALLMHSDLVLPITAAILGAPKDNDLEQRQKSLSFIELSLIQPVFESVTNHLNQHAYADGALRLIKATSEIETDSEPVKTDVSKHAANCRIEGPGFSGILHFQLPKNAIPTGKPAFSIPATAKRTANVEVLLTGTSICRADLAELAIGDILMTEIAPESLLTASVDGLPSFRGTMGIFQGRKALQIEEKVAKLG